MQKILLIIIFGFLIHSCTSSKRVKDGKRYFNENNVEISKSKFHKIRSTNKLLEVPGDSTNHRKLVVREERGKITNRPVLELLIENQINAKIDPKKPIVIIYYPGKDPCNSSGSATKKSLKNWHEQLAEGTQQLAKTKPIYIYKNNAGLEKYNGIITWHKDPKGIVERLFFEYHYPCSSFVVISKEGEYISYFGEFPKDYVWEATQIMME